MIDVARRLREDNQILVNEFWSYHTIGDEVRFTLVHRTREAAPAKGREPAVAKGAKVAGREPAIAKGRARSSTPPRRKDAPPMKRPARAPAKAAETIGQESSPAAETKVARAVCPVFTRQARLRARLLDRLVERGRPLPRALLVSNTAGGQGRPHPVRSRNPALARAAESRCPVRLAGNHRGQDAAAGTRRNLAREATAERAFKRARAAEVVEVAERSAIAEVAPEPRSSMSLRTNSRNGLRRRRIEIVEVSQDLVSNRPLNQRLN